MKAVLFLMACLLVTGCSPNKNLTSSSENMNYDLNENGCDTGNKHFGSRDAMCDALKDDSQNNYCARSSRYQYFQQECPGRSWNADRRL